MPQIPLWITEAEVVSLVNVPAAIGALERILPMEARDQARNMKKGVLMVAENDAMHVLGASVAGAGLCGFKTWVNIRGQSSTVVILFSTENGECQAVIEATARLLPGVLGNEESISDESHADGLIEYPQYTRPEEFRGEKVPDVLRSGNHAAIARWRRKESLRRTMERRPDLLETAELSEEDRALLEEIRDGDEPVRDH